MAHALDMEQPAIHANWENNGHSRAASVIVAWQGEARKPHLVKNVGPCVECARIQAHPGWVSILIICGISLSRMLARADT